MFQHRMLVVKCRIQHEQVVKGRLVIFRQKLPGHVAHGHGGEVPAEQNPGRNQGTIAFVAALTKGLAEIVAEAEAFTEGCKENSVTYICTYLSMWVLVEYFNG